MIKGITASAIALDVEALVFGHLGGKERTVIFTPVEIPVDYTVLIGGRVTRAVDLVHVFPAGNPETARENFEALVSGESGGVF